MHTKLTCIHLQNVLTAPVSIKDVLPGGATTQNHVPVAIGSKMTTIIANNCLYANHRTNCKILFVRVNGERCVLKNARYSYLPSFMDARRRDAQGNAAVTPTFFVEVLKFT